MLLVSPAFLDAVVQAAEVVEAWYERRIRTRASAEERVAAARRYAYALRVALCIYSLVAAVPAPDNTAQESTRLLAHAREGRIELMLGLLHWHALLSAGLSTVTPTPDSEVRP
jgi:hypothetical protein